MNIGTALRSSLLLVCALTGGCDYIFRIDHISLADDARAVDSTGDSEVADSGPDAATACANPMLYDPFTGPEVCLPWGTMYMSSTTVTEHGSLVITPSTTADSVGGCLSGNTYTIGSGVSVIVSEVLQGAGTYTVMEVHGLELQIKAAGGLLRFQNSASTDIGTVPYTSDMTWWRMRGVSSTTVAEYSKDGNNWNTIGTLNAVPSGAIGVELTGGSNGTTVSGSAVFEQLMICP